MQATAKKIIHQTKRTSTLSLKIGYILAQLPRQNE
jgi:hypothetical protein